MKLSEISTIAPPDVPVATVPFRGAELDIHRISSRDVLFVLSRAPALVDAWTMEDTGAEHEVIDEETGETSMKKGMGSEKIGALLTAIGKAGPEVIGQLIRSGLRATEKEVEGAQLGLEEEIDIVLAVLEHGIPESLLEKLLGGLGRLSSRVVVRAE